jgi:hypothetical protein
VMLVGGLRKRVGSGILLRSATRSWWKGPGDIVDPGREWPLPAGGWLLRNGMAQERHGQKGLHQGQS